MKLFNSQLYHKCDALGSRPPQHVDIYLSSCLILHDSPPQVEVEYPLTLSQNIIIVISL